MPSPARRGEVCWIPPRVASSRDAHGLLEHNTVSDLPYIVAGTETGRIPVRISYRIIELFSEGLYASPNKAIEELVSNAFDAGATNAHVIISPDRTIRDAFIAVVDDGTGMRPDDLRQHWLIGVSNKRELRKPPKGRKQIGKFGIGKLATYVLSTHLTHVCRINGKYFATTMDYSQIPHGEVGGIYTEETVELPLRELSETQAQEALSSIVHGSKPGYRAIKLFGKGAAPTWTVAIMSGLKEMAREIQKGRLSWVLRTAMPLRDDFNLYLDGELLSPSKASTKPVRHWVLGKDIKDLDKPAPDDLEVSVDDSAPLEHRFGLAHPELGRVTGYAEVYEDSLTAGKSSGIGRSHGFFVYAFGRLINVYDIEGLFGLEPLHHGTWARFRMVAHIDQLDNELRSSRESLREGRLLGIARDLLHAVFNHARTWLQQHDEKEIPGTRATGHIAQSPWSLTRRPIIALLKSAFDGKASPLLLVYPADLTNEGQNNLILALRERAQTDDGLVVRADLDENLSQEQGIAVLDVEAGTLKINALHPFVAAHRDEYERGRETLGLLAMAEVLTEAHLYELGLDPNLAKDIMLKRDGRQHRYSVSLEAKSKLAKDKKVSAKTVGIATVALHRNEWRCDHALVVGPDFPTGQGDKSSLIKQARDEKKRSSKTITIIKVVDLARLVRLIPLKGIGLDRLRDLFQNCVSPEECRAWIEGLLKEQPKKTPYKAILDTIWDLQKEVPAEAVEFAAVTTALRKDRHIEIAKPELVDLCKAMSRMTSHVVVRQATVELTQRPDKVIEAAGGVLQQFPEDEQKNSIFKFHQKT
jgi:hypothetical protein